MNESSPSSSSPLPLKIGALDSIKAPLDLFIDAAKIAKFPLPLGFKELVSGEKPLGNDALKDLKNDMSNMSRSLRQVINRLVEQVTALLHQAASEKVTFPEQSVVIIPDTPQLPTRETLLEAILEQQEKVSHEERKKTLANETTSIITADGVRNVQILIHGKKGIIGVKKRDAIIDTIDILLGSSGSLFVTDDGNISINTVVCTLPDNTRRIFTVSDKGKIIMDERSVVQKFKVKGKPHYLTKGAEIGGQQLLVSEGKLRIEGYDMEIYDFGGYGHVLVYRDMFDHVGNIIIQSLLHYDKKCTIPVSALAYDNKGAGLVLEKPLPKNTGIPMWWLSSPFSNNYHLSLSDLAKHWHSH